MASSPYTNHLRIPICLGIVTLKIINESVVGIIDASTVKCSFIPISLQFIDDIHGTYNLEESIIKY